MSGFAKEKLICPNCQYPVTEPFAQALGTGCPRCNTWLELDPICQSSCINCHKLKQKNPSPCLIDTEIPLSGLNNMTNSQGNVAKRSNIDVFMDFLGKYFSVR